MDPITLEILQHVMAFVVACGLYLFLANPQPHSVRGLHGR